jgi:hypothetical protein
VRIARCDTPERTCWERELLLVLEQVRSGCSSRRRRSSELLLRLKERLGLWSLIGAVGTVIETVRATVSVDRGVQRREHHSKVEIGNGRGSRVSW